MMFNIFRFISNTFTLQKYDFTIYILRYSKEIDDFLW